MPSFLDIKQDVFDRIGQPQTPQTEVIRRIGRYVNRWNRRVLSAPGMGPLRRVRLTKASVANQPEYGIALEKIKWMVETTTQRRIYEKSLGWYRQNFPDPSRWTGTSLDYVVMGYGRVHTRPSSAAEIFVKSTSASDTGTAYAEVVRSDGYTRSLSVTMTGSSAVSLGSAITDVIDVQDFYLSTAAAGTVTLHMTSGAGTELSRIPIGQKAGKFLRYALAPTPSSVISYLIDGEAQLTDLSNDTDEPFPSRPDFHDILVDGAVHDEYVNKGLVGQAQKMLNGGSPSNPTPDSIEGRIRALRMSILDWGEEDDDEQRTFDQTIHLPVEDAP